MANVISGGYNNRTGKMERRYADGTVSEPSVHCECGEWSGEPCKWTGPKSDTVLVEYMPEQHRSSHSAARNSGGYPHNGVLRLRVEKGCAELIVDNAGPEWARVL